MVATKVVGQNCSTCDLETTHHLASSKPAASSIAGQSGNPGTSFPSRCGGFGPASSLTSAAPLAIRSLPEGPKMQISMRPTHAALRSGQARPTCMPAAARPALRLANTQQQRMAFQAPLEPSAQVHRGVTAQAAASSSASSSWPSAEKEQPRSWLATLSAHIARAAMLAGLVFAVVRCCCFPSCTCA